MFLICCLIHWVCSWHAALGMLPIKSTAATYTERTRRKKSCLLNNLLYNSWKHFKVHSEILFSAQWKFQKFPSPLHPPLFLPPLIRFRRILLSSNRYMHTYIIGFSFWCSNKFHKKTLLFPPPNKRQYHRHDTGNTYSQKDLPIPLKTPVNHRYYRDCPIALNRVNGWKELEVNEQNTKIISLLC